MIERLTQAKEVSKEEEGHFRTTLIKKSMMRSVLGMEEASFERWSDEGSVPPDVFDKLEWACFSTLYINLSGAGADQSFAPLFTHSKQYQDFQLIYQGEQREIENENLQAYREHRYAKLLLWSKEFKKYERKVAVKADEAMDVLLDTMVEEVWEDGIEASWFSIKLREEKRLLRLFESRVALTFQVEDALVEEIYDHYLTALIDKMWSVEELRKGVLEYTGLISRLDFLEYGHMDDFKSSAWFNPWMAKVFRDEEEAEEREERERFAI